MEERRINSVDTLAETLNKTSLLDFYPSTWFRLYPDESPYSVLGIDPYASRQETTKALSEIKEESSTKIKQARHLLITSKDILNLEATAKFTAITSQWHRAKSNQDQMETIKIAVKMVDSYCIDSQYGCTFFEETYSSLKKSALHASGNQLLSLMQIVDKQKTFCDKIKKFHTQKQDIIKFEDNLTEILKILAEQFQFKYRLNHFTKNS